MNTLVTGAAGFIGSNLVDRLLAAGHYVTGVDNFSTGQHYFLDQARAHPNFRLERGDILNKELLISCMRDVQLVLHMAANADVRFGLDHPTKDFQQNAQGTLNVLEAMRICKVPTIAFASTGSVYGEASVIPTPENHPFPVQTSLYGASKLAAEGLIQGYSEGFGIRAYIFRFVSILGERYTHGHVIDFYRQLAEHPGSLNVLGDGTQRKSYLYVHDCVAAILAALDQDRQGVNIFNLGTDEYCQVNDSIGWICEELGCAPNVHYSGGSRGWIGDSPFIFLDCSRIRGLGWQPRLTIRESIVQTVRYLRDHAHRIESALASF
ncbi:MAG: NAD-dependent epimerase/dehydratase family protein [Bryobacteraceae bacterium]